VLRRTLPALLAVALLAAACSDGDEPAPAAAGAEAADCGAAAAVDERDLAYTEIAGVDPDQLSLDLTVPERDGSCAAVPLVVWVHGGGWSNGDRKGQAVEDKRTLFTEAGWAFASVDYRLSPRPLDLEDPEAVRYPAHNNDVAAAVAWLEAQADDYGVDPERIALLGHSAGAGIVAGVATDPSHLERAGSGLDAVACTVAVDTESYDVASSATNPPTAEVYQNAFTTDPGTWEQASPMNHIEGNTELSPFLVVTRGTPRRIAQSTDLVEALQAEGVDAELLERNPYTHADVSRLIGQPGDQVMTPPVLDFLTSCFGGEAPSVPA
jgi:acetyl esterase/lipase